MATQRVIVLCDGTWSGSETNTKTNIFLLARMMGIPMTSYFTDARAEPISHQDNARGIRACYFPGAGLGGTFLEYLFNGAAGDDIDDNCIKVYEYIVQHYTPQLPQTPQPEIWMFGFSRGAYTVRCVAGMINNCGILKRRLNGQAVSTNNNADLTPEERALCKQVYKIYRSDDPEDNPEAPRSTKFRNRASHNVPTPVKFMGLIDTVGGLGIPYLNPGIGLTHREFHDTKISAVVEKVYHALCIHDRLWAFKPCHALPARQRTEPQFEIHERWFPGCHYDVGRQRFRFFRYGGDGAAVGRLLNDLSEIILPNQVFADLVLKWLLESIREHSGNNIIPNIDTEITDLITNMPSAPTGSGDVYSNLLQYGPLGSAWGTLVDILNQCQGSNNVATTLSTAVSTARSVAEPLWEVARSNVHVFDAIIRKARLDNIPLVDMALDSISNIFNLNPFSDRAQGIFRDLGVILSSQFLLREFRIITDVLAQTKDRRISDVSASVTEYDTERLEGRTIKEIGGIDRQQGAYRSQTYEDFQAFCEIMR